MATNYVNDGNVITYSNSGTAISSNDVVPIGEIIGVALEDIAATTGTGSVAISGVFTLPAVEAAVIAQGEEVIWDASEGAFEDNAHSPGTGDITGCCIAVAASGNGDTTVKVKINVGIGTVN